MSFLSKLKLIFIYLFQFSYGRLIFPTAEMPNLMVLDFCTSENTFTHSFLNPIDCSNGVTIAVISFSTFYTQKNVESHNNRFKISDKLLEIPPGNYNLTELCECISDLEGGDKLRVSPIYVLNRVRLESNLPIDFNVENSACELFGFEKRIYEPSKTHLGVADPQLKHIHSLNINCDQAQGALHNGFSTGKIHTANVLVPPNFRIYSEPKNLIRYKFKNFFLDRITLNITDENGHLISRKWGSDFRLSVAIDEQ